MRIFSAVVAVGLFTLIPLLAQAQTEETVSDQYLWHNWNEISPAAQAVWVGILTQPGWDVVWVEWTRVASHTLVILYLYNRTTKDHATAIADYGVPIREANLWKLVWRVSRDSGHWHWEPSEEVLGRPFTN
ncbi:hypothetical protein HY230_07080 [Candidatus Acetothermia bacterium]|nr:hypothetical protein [Candidatus Acetothermia bacterium]